MIIIFVEFIDQLIDYPINCASLKSYVAGTHWKCLGEMIFISTYTICFGGE